METLAFSEMEQQTSGKRAFFGYFLSLATKSYSPQAKFGKSIEEVRFFAVLRMTEIAGQARNDEVESPQ